MIKEYQLEGIRCHEINVLPDERGFFAEALRRDGAGHYYHGFYPPYK